MVICFPSKVFISLDRAREEAKALQKLRGMDTVYITEVIEEYTLPVEPLKIG